MMSVKNNRKTVKYPKFTNLGLIITPDSRLTDQNQGRKSSEKTREVK